MFTSYEVTDMFTKVVSKFHPPTDDTNHLYLFCTLYNLIYIYFYLILVYHILFLHPQNYHSMILGEFLKILYAFFFPNEYHKSKLQHFFYFICHLFPSF